MKRLTIKINENIKDIYAEQLCLFDYELPSDDVIRKNIMNTMDFGEDEQIGQVFWSGHNITDFLEFE